MLSIDISECSLLMLVNECSLLMLVTIVGVSGVSLFLVDIASPRASI